MIKRIFLMLTLLLVVGTSMAQTVVTVDNRVIIDSRGLPAGAITATPKARDTKATNSTVTTDNSIADLASAASNATVSYYFEVAKSDLSPSDKTWLGSLQGCKGLANSDGKGAWRLPTQRELQLIWVLHETIKAKNVSGFLSFDSNNYWSATESSSTFSWYVTFTSGFTASNYKTVTTLKVRCVRDVTP